jgi:hypothetical protein
MIVFLFLYIRRCFQEASEARYLRPNKSTKTEAGHFHEQSHYFYHYLKKVIYLPVDVKQTFTS